MKGALEVADNTGLYQWLAEQGKRVTVVSPEAVRGHYVEFLQDILNLYK